MKKYTIGILIDTERGRVLLIEKQKPHWQKGLYNFPGGKIEPGESISTCVCREFQEETGLTTFTGDWFHIGRIENGENYV
jgi:8-oxo-dGTP pyrophosphatase MutT (NUDIX family)